MSEKKRIKWKLNLFDIGLMAVVLVVAVGLLAWKYVDANRTTVDPNSGETVAPGVQTVRYVVALEQVHPNVAQMVAQGDVLYERTKKELMGTVEKAEVGPALVLSKNQEKGTFLYAEVPDRKNVTVELTTQGTYQERSIVLSSGLEIRAGMSVRVFGPGYYGTGFVLSVERG